MALGLATAGAVVFFADAVIIDIVETALRSLQAEAGPDVVTATVKAALVGAVSPVAALLTFAGASAQAVTTGFGPRPGNGSTFSGSWRLSRERQPPSSGPWPHCPPTPIVLPYWWLLGVSAALFGAVLVRRLLLLRRNRRGLGHRDQWDRRFRSPGEIADHPPRSGSGGQPGRISCDPADDQEAARSTCRTARTRS